MPGTGGGGGASGAFILLTVVPGLVFGPTFLSGYCMHRVKCSKQEGRERYCSYALSWLVGMAPVLVLFFIVSHISGGDDTGAVCWYGAAVTFLLFGMLHCSPPDKRYLMYIPGIAGIPIFFYFMSHVIV